MCGWSIGPATPGCEPSVDLGAIEADDVGCEHEARDLARTPAPKDSSWGEAEIIGNLAGGEKGLVHLNMGSQLRRLHRHRRRGRVDPSPGLSLRSRGRGRAEGAGVRGSEGSSVSCSYSRTVTSPLPRRVLFRPLRNRSWWKQNLGAKRRGPCSCRCRFARSARPRTGAW